MKEKVKIQGVPETMLWTLHNRASEAMKKNGFISDKLCLSIYQSIHYDYEKNFGKPDGSHGFRSYFFDKKIREWRKKHPHSPIVELGVGLETSFFRLKPQGCQWYALDVPEAIKIREKFIPPHENLHNISQDALDFSWLEKIPEDEEGRVFISAQGLFMYFKEDQVRELLVKIVERFPRASFAFDIIPPWLSKKAMKGWKKTPYYTAPKMPWGISRNKLEEKIASWLPKHSKPLFFQYKFRGFLSILPSFLCKVPILKNHMPYIVCIPCHMLMG